MKRNPLTQSIRNMTLVAFACMAFVTVQPAAAQPRYSETRRSASSLPSTWPRT